MQGAKRDGEKRKQSAEDILQLQRIARVQAVRLETEERRKRKNAAVRLIDWSAFRDSSCPVFSLFFVLFEMLLYFTGNWHRKTGDSSRIDGG